MPNPADIFPFDNPRELEDLLGRNASGLPALDDAFGVRSALRDLTLSLAGPREAVARAADFLRGLLRARNAGFPFNPAFVAQMRAAFAEGRPQELDRILSLRIDVDPTRPPVFPRTLGQADFLAAVRAHDLTLGIGPAGTGKTWLAVALAVEALRKGDVSRIVLTRPAVEAGEALGFLPGDLHQKILPYLRPLVDALHEMLPRESLPELMERGTVEVAPLAYMRGRTLNRAFIILDEAQNATREQMLMFLTRLGNGSRAVVNGDLSQVDLPPSRLPGLLEASSILAHTPGIAIVRLSAADVVRHPLVQRIIEAYAAAPAPSAPPKPHLRKA